MAKINFVLLPYACPYDFMFFSVAIIQIMIQINFGQNSKTFPLVFLFQKSTIESFNRKCECVCVCARARVCVCVRARACVRVRA